MKARSLKNIKVTRLHLSKELESRLTAHLCQKLRSTGRLSYTEEDFEHMAPIDVTIGIWTPSWLTAANQATAARGKRPVTWINSAHAPHVTMPQEMAKLISQKTEQYLKP